jgi:predicted unusual protein kinase regulating ubiquinone biosynthesis (AarF/ABC1/UbiB family)
VLEELDYEREAEHQRAFHALFDGHPFIHVPRIVDSHSTAHVITMELAEGRSFAELERLGDVETRNRHGEIIYRFVLGNILRHRLFNGDPHPGNYLFDGGRVAFLDFGCVKRFPEPMFHTWRAMVRSHLAGDRDRFRALAAELGFFRADDRTLDADRVYDYFAYFYEPFHEDREFAFTREYNQRSFRQILAPDGQFAGMQRHLNMPRDFVFVNRIHWGVYSILARLGVRANFHRIHREYLDDGAPSTELGRAEAEYRAARAQSAAPGGA